MQNMNPRVSIGMPVYNGAQHVAEALESLLSQEFTDFELIISDNASSDKTPEICQRFARADKRVGYYRSRANEGAAENYNRVFRLSRGEYFKWAAHDDISRPEYLRHCVEILDAEPSRVVLCYARTVLIDEAGQVLREYDDQLDIRGPDPGARLRHLLRNLALCNALFGLIRSSALKKTRLIGTYAGSDVVLLAELAMQGEFREIPRPLFFRRMQGCRSANGNETPRHMLGNKTCAQISAWFDPRTRPLMTIPQTKRFLEHLRAVHRSDLSLLDKVDCYEVVLQERLARQRQWRVLGGEFKQAIRQHLKHNGNGQAHRG